MGKTYHKRNELIDGYKARKHPNYSTWSNMKRRCNNSDDKAYSNYGGRGIGYCNAWEHFKNFCNDMGVKPGDDYTIERINNDEGYSKANCKWATRHEQSINRRTFKSNTTGFTGVKLVTKSGRYTAQAQYKLKSYKIGGTFETAQEAKLKRDELLTKLRSGECVEHLLHRPARFDSSTGVKGISKHQDGGFTVRVTVGGCRKYLGYYKKLDDAKEALKNG